MKITKKSGTALAATAAILLMSGAVTTPAPAADNFEACLGVNACKGKGACKSASNACKGKNACKGRGHVKMTKAQCDAIGGVLGLEVFGTGR